MTSRFCNFCGGPLGGEHYRYLRPRGQLTICRLCEAWARRCVVCGAPIAPVANSAPPAACGERGELCNYCAGGQLVCSGCGQFVGQRGFGRVGEAEIFCATCFEQRERCLSCGKPIVGEVWRLAEGRHLCDRCHQSSVVNDREAHLLFDQVMRWVSVDVGLRVYRRPTLALVEGAALDALRAGVLPLAGQGVATHEESHLLGLFQQQGAERAIWIQRGLPALVMVKVIAHEYGHAWQAENAPFLHDLQLSEGFCEWVSYQVVGLMDVAGEQRRMRAAAGFYGDALRRVLAIEAGAGKAGVIAAVRRVAPPVFRSS